MDYLMTRDEVRQFCSGRLYRCQEKLGAHPVCEDGREGCRFSVWAPGVQSVQVIGQFNNWREGEHFLRHTEAGIWSGFIAGVKTGDLYKYLITSAAGEKIYKADPCGFFCEKRPGTASRVADLSGYRWQDGRWMARRRARSHFSRPMNIYEVHPGSWRRREDGSFLNYRELGKQLAEYAAGMGYTHIELMPVTEYPFDGSWGYQTTGYFAPTSRYGTPEDFMSLVDLCHQKNLGVILDWVPGHFCRDAHGLGRFNGEKLYELFDHRQWGTYVFDFGRPEVRSFLISSALFWLKQYHIDGLRVDGVTSMLYLNFGVENPQEKRYNQNGTEENLEAIRFIRDLNQAIGTAFPDVFTVAEESSAFPLVTYPPQNGGLGFHYKWNMGWMNDTLQYMSQPFGGRRDRHDLLTFSMMYAFAENYILPLSHDEVVHGKRSLIGRMPGRYEQQFAGLRLLYLYQMCHPGGKLTFMGSEIAQFIEWRYYEPLEWFLLDYEKHRQYQIFVRKVNRLYRTTPALWAQDHSWDGFQWIDADNREQSILIFRRTAGDGSGVLVLLNFSDRSYTDYRVGVPQAGLYRELLNTDRTIFGGEGRINYRKTASEPVPMHGCRHSVRIQVPALGGLILSVCQETPDEEENDTCLQTKKNS